MIITQQLTEKMSLIRDLNKSAAANNETAEQNRVAAVSDFDFEPLVPASQQKLTPAERNTAIGMLERMGIKIVPMPQFGEALREII